MAEDPDYDGSIGLIRKEFNFMMRYYVERLFNENLVPKLICGRKVRCTGRVVSPCDSCVCSVPLPVILSRAGDRVGDASLH